MIDFCGQIIVRERLIPHNSTVRQSSYHGARIKIYTRIELESAAFEFAVQRNLVYLYGHPDFTVITNHKPLLAHYNSYRADCYQEYTDTSSTYKVTTSNSSMKQGKITRPIICPHTRIRNANNLRAEGTKRSNIGRHAREYNHTWSSAVALEQIKAATAKDTQL